MAKSDHETATPHSQSTPQQQHHHTTTQQQPSPPLSTIQSLTRSVSPTTTTTSTPPTLPPHQRKRSQSSTRSLGIHVADISYPESFMRTPVAMLPFPHPKYHIRPSTGEIYEVTSPILEEYDCEPEMGYIDSVGEVRESIENGGGGSIGGSSGSGSGSGSVGSEKGRLWRGYVEHQESGERWCLRREGKRCFDGEGDAARKKSRGS
ncbi:Nn.00g103530.m01.CDS01 [Neocucurbitaria sp. VM-36]